MDRPILSRDVGGEPCENCDKIEFPKFACADCGLGYCEDCWDKAKVHARGRLNSNGVPHEKLNREIADRLRSIFTPPSDPEEQRRLHNIDADTIWFGVLRNATGLPVLQDYGRYAKIMQESSNGDHIERWPQLVSFVGQTGAGKSTIVKTLVEYQRSQAVRDNNEFPTPIAGSIDDSAPTSGDVHLYVDPSTYDSKHPLLYADCEGMDGGERIPIGATNKDHGIRSQAPKKLRKAHKSVKREMVWANDPEKRKREFAVKNLYPRLLYAFSDVVVFVLRNARTFESSALVPMLKWAAASIEGSVNQSAMPHAVIVLNFTDPSTDPNGWTTSVATESLLGTFSNAVWDNEDVSSHARYWQKRGHAINNTRDLLLCYYSSIHVVRIPQKGRYALVDQQAQELNHQIRERCAEARENRKRLRVTFNSEEFQAALSMGFDHFSKRLDAPFDFVELSWNLNPIPKDFGGNILRLALAIKNDPMMQNATGPEVFQHLGHMVASCIMLDFVRHKIKGTASRLILHYKQCYTRALKEFCEDWWPCSYVDKRGRRCVNTKRGHAKGHQDEKGSILLSGTYQTSESFTEENYAPMWHDSIEESLETIKNSMERLQSGDSAKTEEAAATELHLKRMNEFYSNLGDLSAYTNHSACFSCLRELPQHPLPCGHVLCTNCVKSFAYEKDPVSFVMDCCPLHDTEKWDPWIIHVKPSMAGIRILSLDGGGIRSTVQLQILREIGRHIGDDVQIAAFFDLILATGTGGILALGLGVENWNLDKCEHHFEDLMQRAFVARDLSKIPVLESIYKHKGKYKTKIFVDGLQDLFGNSQLLFGGKSDRQRFRRNVAVMSTTEAGQKAVVLSNYNRPSKDAEASSQKAQYDFERPERAGAELKLWEVCRATTAVTGFFKPFCNERTGINYVDAALYYNNPIHIANDERKLIWPDVEGQPPDVVLSIGTSWKEQPKTTENGKLARYKLKMFKTAINRFDNTEDAEATWDQFLQDVHLPNSSINDRYVRLNPKVQKQPKFDDIKEYETFKKLTRMTLKTAEWTTKTRLVAYRLIASSFYFEKVRNDTDENVVQGYIHCRFPERSIELKSLGKKLRELRSHYFGPHFVVAEHHQDHIASDVEIPTDTIAAMINDLSFSMDIIKISLSSKVARTTISLRLRQDEQALPISGFPRHLLTEERTELPRVPSRTKTKRLSRRVNPDVAGTVEDADLTDTSSEHMPYWARERPSRNYAFVAELADTSTSASTDTTSTFSEPSRLHSFGPHPPDLLRASIPMQRELFASRSEPELFHDRSELSHRARNSHPGRLDTPMSSSREIVEQGRSRKEEINFTRQVNANYFQDKSPALPSRSRPPVPYKKPTLAKSLPTSPLPATESPPASSNIEPCISPRQLPNPPRPKPDFLQQSQSGKQITNRGSTDAMPSISRSLAISPPSSYHEYSSNAPQHGQGRVRYLAQNLTIRPGDSSPTSPDLTSYRSGMTEEEEFLAVVAESMRPTGSSSSSQPGDPSGAVYSSGMSEEEMLELTLAESLRIF